MAERVRTVVTDLRADCGASGAVPECTPPQQWLGTAAYKDVPTSGDALATQVVLGNDTRLSGTSQSDISLTTYTLSDDDHRKVLRFTASTAVGVTVDNSLRSGWSATLLQDGLGQITLTGSGVTIRNRQGHTSTAGQYGVVTLFKVASGEMRLSGDTA